MTNQLLTCPSCGQKNRIPANPPPRAAWKCGKCGNALMRQATTAPTEAPGDPPAQPRPPEPGQALSPERPSASARETRLAFSWPLALKSLSIGGGIAALGVAIAVLGDSTGAAIGGGILAVIGAIALVVMFADGFGGVGSCPICSAEIAATSNSEPHKLCPGCREYLTIKDSIVRQLDASAISPTPIFAAPTPWEDLKAVTYIPEGTLTTASEERSLHAKWPNGCCVCGEPASRLEDRSILIYKWNGDLVRINQTKITLLITGVPHCDVHAKGVTIEMINFRSKGDDDLKQDLALVFRSYAYRNQFLELNPWPWR